jgi:two-component system, chemotaxis family, chemotaxis protein CheY
VPIAANVRVLCVDDQESMLRLHRFAFTQLGVRQITEAKSAVDAMYELTNKKFDLITLDWNMPDVDGLELFKAIRADEKTKAIPIIMVTANSDEQSVKKAIATGVRLFLRKPITVKDLKARVEAAIGKLT